MITVMQEIKQGFVVIELSPIDQEQFVLFQKHYKEFKEMIDEGVFDVKGGSAVIDFDCAVNISRIIRQLYSHGTFPR